MCEMRTCKTCGETKPLEKNFRVSRIYEAADGPKVHRYHSCIVCMNKAQNKKHKEKRGREKALMLIDTKQPDTSESIRAAHAACPILGLGLWTNQAAER